jgi:glycosyltransferase involved in cell wall biosynthesis
LTDKLPELSIIVIAYNEETNIINVVEELVSVFTAKLNDYEVIIVNDGSTDQTGELADRLSAENKSVFALHHSERKGMGGARKTGYAKARGNYVTWLPADGQIPPKEILKLWSAIEEADFVTSSYTRRPDAKSRLLISRILRKLMKLILNYDLNMEGVYLFRRSILEKVELKSDTMMLTFEFPLKVSRLGFKMKHAVIDCRPRISGESKVTNLKTILTTFHELLKLRWDMRHYPRAGIKKLRAASRS